MGKYDKWSYMIFEIQRRSISDGLEWIVGTDNIGEPPCEGAYKSKYIHATSIDKHCASYYDSVAWLIEVKDVNELFRILEGEIICIEGNYYGHPDASWLIIIDDC